MKTAIAVLLIVVGTGTIAYGQTPVEPIDIRADTIEFSFPDPDTILVQAYFTIHTSHTTSQSYSSNLVLRLDGLDVWSTSMTVNTPTNDCGNDPDCNDMCLVEVSTGGLVWDNCDTWTTWTGVGCDPADPDHTCVPMDVCACGSQYVVVAELEYSDEEELELVADSATLVNEADETNNTAIAFVQPVRTEPTTWGRIKALYR
jgi:hypothetical protein